MFFLSEVYAEKNLNQLDFKSNSNFRGVCGEQTRCWAKDSDHSWHPQTGKLDFVVVQHFMKNVCKCCIIKLSLDIILTSTEILCCLRSSSLFLVSVWAFQGYPFISDLIERKHSSPPASYSENLNEEWIPLPNWIVEKPIFPAKVKINLSRRIKFPFYEW